MIPIQTPKDWEDFKAQKDIDFVTHDMKGMLIHKLEDHRGYAVCTREKDSEVACVIKTSDYARSPDSVLLSYLKGKKQTFIITSNCCLLSFEKFQFTPTRSRTECLKYCSLEPTDIIVDTSMVQHIASWCEKNKVSASIEQLNCKYAYYTITFDSNGNLHVGIRNGGDNYDTVKDGILKRIELQNLEKVMKSIETDEGVKYTHGPLLLFNARRCLEVKPAQEVDI